MTQLQRILVGIDLARTASSPEWNLSEPVQEAVARSLQLAESTRSELTFLAVLELPGGKAAFESDESPVSIENLRRRAFDVMQELIQRAADSGITAKIELRFGRAWVEMIRYVVQNNIDLLMIGTRDQGRLSQALFGSTGTKLLRNCPCPVWVTKPDDGNNEFNLMIATDLSEVGDRLLQTGVQLAQLLEARLLILHSIENHTDMRIRFSDLSDEQVQQVHDERVDQAEQILHRQLATTDYRTLQWGIQVEITDGPADQVILEAVERHEIDLLVLGTVARSGIPGVLVGNTAERLLPDIRCSLLAIKPSGFECPIPLED